MTAPVDVVQSDRDAAADYGLRMHTMTAHDREKVRKGLWDETEEVQWHARHRLTSAPSSDVTLREALERLVGEDAIYLTGEEHDDDWAGGDMEARVRDIKFAREALRTPSAQPADRAGETLTIPKLHPVYAEEHPLLSPILDKRRQAAGTFTPEFSGQRGSDFDRGLLCAFEAVNAALQKMQAAALPPAATQGEG